MSGNYVANWLSVAFAWHVLEDGRVDLANLHWTATRDVLLILDAAVLLAFAATYPRPTALARSRAFAAAVALVVAGALAWRLGARDSNLQAAYPFPWPLVASLLMFHAAYATALVLLVRGYRHAEFASTREEMAPILAAFLLIVPPRVLLLDEDLRLGFYVGHSAALAFRLIVTLGVTAVVLAALARVGSPEERRRVRPWFLTGALLVLAICALWVVDGIGDPSGGRRFQTPFGNQWVLVAVLIDVAVARNRFIDLDRRLVRPVRAGLVLAAGGAAFLLLRAALNPLAGHEGSGPEGDLLAGLGGALVVVAVAAGSRRWGESASSQARWHDRKLDAYRSLVEATLEAGRPLDDPGLAARRRALGLSDQEHADVLAVVEAERAVRVARGPESVIPSGYRAVRALSGGATSWTVLAMRESDGASVVVKALRPEWRAHPRAREAFLAEARHLDRVRHPNVVRAIEFPESPPALVLEHAERGSLAEAVAREGPFHAQGLLRLAREAFAGLAALHAAGIVHGDLKPENVLLRADGTAVLGDLGVAREAPDARGTKTLVDADGERGTSLYLAPEQVRGRPGDARSDVYALAATLVFAATGWHYLNAEGMSEFGAKRRIVEGRVEVPNRVAEPLARALRACLAKDPEARPRDAGAAGDALGRS